MDFLIEEINMQMNDSCTEEVRDAKVDLLMNPTVDEFNQYMNQSKSESDKLAECLLEIKPERWSYALFKGPSLVSTHAIFQTLLLTRYSQDMILQLCSWLTC
jgi:hypothetical protein